MQFIQQQCVRALSRLIVSSIVLSSLTTVAASAQSGVFRQYAKIPRVFRAADGSDSTVLQWACGTVDHPVLKVGSRGIREVVIDGITLTYPDTLTKTPRIDNKPVPMPPGTRLFRGNLYVDTKAPDRLRVNPWGPKGDSMVFGSDGSAVTVTKAELRKCKMFYALENRVSLTFATAAWTIGPAVIPFRVRPGYEATNKAKVQGEVSTAVNLAIYAGRTFGRTEYFYVENGTNTLRESARFTIGPFVSFGGATADSASTLSAREGLRNGAKAQFVTASPGFSVMFSIKGVDAGLFGAREFALGGAEARKWDRNKKYWWGFGLGYQLFK